MRHGPRQVKNTTQVDRLLAKWITSGNRWNDIKKMSLAITEPKRNSSTYKESGELRQMRRRARQVGRSPGAKTPWKQVWKQKKKEREEWEKVTLAKVLRGDWEALQASKRPAITRQWTGRLLQDGNWKQNVKIISKAFSPRTRRNKWQKHWRTSGKTSRESVDTSPGNPSPGGKSWRRWQNGSEGKQQGRTKLARKP